MTRVPASISPLYRTALLVFSRTAREEAAIKQLAPGKNALHVASDLLEHTRQVAAASGLDVHWVGSEQQAGSHFGERIAHAFAQVFALGYQQVMCVGNDCPELSPADLRKAANAFDHTDVVLGPARDGGTYLIGLSRTVFSQGEFSALNWDHGHSLASLMQYAGEQGSALRLLRALADLDQVADWDLVRAQLRYSPLLYKWRWLGLSLNPALPVSERFADAVLWLPGTPLRAPPRLVA